MHLLNTYEDRDEAEKAESLLVGQKRLASERDATETVYNLFGEATWGNFYRLKMYGLEDLNLLLANREQWLEKELNNHKDIVKTLTIVAKKFNLEIPSHWL